MCSISGSDMHSVALDEAHEMLINKDLKTSIVRPTKEYLDRVLYYYPVRSQAMRVLKQQVLLEGKESQENQFSIFDCTPHASKIEENVKAMCVYVNSTSVLPMSSVRNEDLFSLSGQVAKPEQKNDLLSFWEIGAKRFENKVKYFILRDPSASVPQRQAKLLTFSVSKKSKRKIKLIERERKLVNKCIRRSMVWNTKVCPSDQHSGGQYLELPRAISDSHGIPHKGQKSYATQWLNKRYKDLISDTLPENWNPELVLLEGMFLINTTPLCTHQFMREYSQFLVRRFVLPHFIRGASEVHIVFDNPGRYPQSPKAIERQRRDDHSSLPSDHTHTLFSDTCPTPCNWREHLSCRTCKRNLVLYLGKSLIHYSISIVRGHQKVVLAGCFQDDDEDQSWEVSSTGLHRNLDLDCDAEEADTRIWLHVLRSQYRRQLVCSPDTDVYHIGFPLLSQQNDVVVQLNTYTSIEHKFLHVHKLRSALDGDPDLAIVPPHQTFKMMQTLFIATGCDYTSFFAGIGKATFMRIAFQHCSFVNANSESCPGTLVDTTDSKENGFLALLRLVGTAYITKHSSTFQFDSPRVFLNSFTSGDRSSQHREWFECIRRSIWERIEFEDELPPSVEALWRLCLCTCWVSNYWSQAGLNHYSLLDITHYGWKIVSNTVEVDWDDPDNIESIRQRVQLLLRGCSCKKGCNTRRCSCRKSGRQCGPGCSCCNCENGPTVIGTDGADLTLEEEEISEDNRNRKQVDSELVEESDEETDQSDLSEDSEEELGDCDDDDDDNDMC